MQSLSFPLYKRGRIYYPRYKVIGITPWDRIPLTGEGPRKELGYTDLLPDLLMVHWGGKIQSVPNNLIFKMDKRTSTSQRDYTSGQNTWTGAASLVIRKIQITGPHRAPSRMVPLKKTKLWWECGTAGVLIHDCRSGNYCSFFGKLALCAKVGVYISMALWFHLSVCPTEIRTYVH